MQKTKMAIRREIRFSLSAENGARSHQRNTWDGCLVSDYIVPFLILRMTVSGTPDARTGMICNVCELDQLLRSVLPSLQDLYANSSVLAYSRALLFVTNKLQNNVPNGTSLYSTELQVSPWLTCTCIPGADPMLRLSRSYEFAAAHRLHCKELSTEANHDLFGKCNNPSGHGHNYRVDITVEGEPDQQTGMLIPIEKLDESVMQHAIRYFDHKHLNTDCEEFTQRNPTVEMIAEVIRTRLENVLPIRLQGVRVWENEKTYAESLSS